MKIQNRHIRKNIPIIQRLNMLKIAGVLFKVLLFIMLALYDI